MSRPLGYTVLETFLGEQNGRLCIPLHSLQAFPRILRIQRNIGAAGFDNTQESNDHFYGALGANTNQNVWPYTKLPQSARELVRASVQLAIRELFGLIDQSYRVRRPLRLIFNELVQRDVPRIAHPGVIPLPQDLLPLLLTQDRQVG